MIILPSSGVSHFSKNFKMPDYFKIYCFDESIPFRYWYYTILNSVVIGWVTNKKMLHSYDHNFIFLPDEKCPDAGQLISQNYFQ